MSFLRELRDNFFRDFGRSRILRVLFCSFVIGMVWIFADLMSNSYSLSFRDDLICLALGVIAERLIPWGKDR